MSDSLKIAFVGVTLVLTVLTVCAIVDSEERAEKAARACVRNTTSRALDISGAVRECVGPND